MKTVPLGALIRAATVPRAGDEKYPLLSMTMHSGLIDQSIKFKKRVASDDLSNYKVIRRGQLVVGFPIDEGVLDFQSLYDEGIVSPAYAVWDLQDEAPVYRPYLKEFLRSAPALAYYKGRLRGSTARRRSLPTEVFLALPVPLPPVADQRRIAEILDQADALQMKRRLILAHLDALARSVFRDMFGDPLTNNRRIPRAPIGAVAEVVTGNSPPRAEPENFGDSIEWIKSSNLGGDLASTAEEWLSERGRRKARVAPAGSILVTCIAGSSQSIGKASLVDREVAFNQQINAVLPSDLLDASFLLGQLKSAPALVQMKSTGGMKGLVSKSSFQSIEILLPSMQDQREFAGRVSRISSQRTASLQALTAGDELLRSLQARAFRGEL